MGLGPARKKAATWVSKGPARCYRHRPPGGGPVRGSDARDSVSIRLNRCGNLIRDEIERLETDRVHLQRLKRGPAMRHDFACWVVRPILPLLQADVRPGVVGRATRRLMACHPWASRPPVHQSRAWVGPNGAVSTLVQCRLSRSVNTSNGWDPRPNGDRLGHSVRGMRLPWLAWREAWTMTLILRWG
jgi:hypothetical protein